MHTLARNLITPVSSMISLSGMICLMATRQPATMPSKPETSLYLSQVKLDCEENADMLICHYVQNG
jgi:hypothetical protein